jgi:hypothetical protein
MVSWKRRHCRFQEQPVYRQLNPKFIVATLERLSNRIRERFPDSSLGRVSGELCELAKESAPRIDRVRRPLWLLRMGSLAMILAIIALIVTAAFWVHVKVEEEVPLAELFQGVDAAFNVVILLSVALFFFVTLEGRFKRADALRALHQLRSIAHVIDMHQLTKDPESLLDPAASAPSSPQQSMTRFELLRYLDYCSELLSLIGKLAALHVQHLRDPVVLSAVNDVEELSDGLSLKIWQKIDIVDRAAKGAGEGPAGTPQGA